MSTAAPPKVDYTSAVSRLVESLIWEASGSADEPGVYRDVKILGQRSRNKRFYVEEALRRAVPLYEGLAVYVDHADSKHRPVRSRYGRIRRVRFDEQRKELRGDLVYLESQEEVTTLVNEDLKRGLGFFGLSHVADGKWHRNKEGIQVVTEITRVDSVDLVSNPASSSSLREQEEAGAGMVATGPDPHLEALRGGLMAILDAGGTVEELTAKIEEFMSTIKAPKKAEGEEPKKTEEQTLAATVARLTEQVEALTKAAKPKKYITPGTNPAVGTFTEQSDPNVATLDAPPKDKAALKKWLRK